MKYRKTQVYNTMTATGIFYLIFEVSLVLLACFFLSCQANNFVLHIFYVLSIYPKQKNKKFWSSPKGDIFHFFMPYPRNIQQNIQHAPKNKNIFLKHKNTIICH